MKKMVIFNIILCGLLVFTLFQNCSEVAFHKIASSTQEPLNPNDEAVEYDEEEGLLGGHFDLDTSTKVYSNEHWSTDHHVHQFDDKFKTSIIDFLNLQEYDKKFTTPLTNIQPSQKFIIIIANATLSPGAILEINGQEFPVVQFEKDLHETGLASVQRYTLKDLSSLKIKFDKNAIIDGGLVPSATDCVRSNVAGPNGEYRNGALTLQLLNSEAARLDPKTGAASTNGGLLWEATIFWHNKKTCF